MAYITAGDLDRVLQRAKDKDALGMKIAEAIALIEGVLDDYGYAVRRGAGLMAGSRPSR